MTITCADNFDHYTSRQTICTGAYGSPLLSWMEPPLDEHSTPQICKNYCIRLYQIPYILSNPIISYIRRLDRTVIVMQQCVTILCYSPTLAFRNLLPMRWSIPMALATSSTSAPVASQSAEMEFMLLMRCAKNAFAA